MGVSNFYEDVLINSFEEAYSVQLVKLGLGSVQEVALNLKALHSVTLATSQELMS